MQLVIEGNSATKIVADAVFFRLKRSVICEDCGVVHKEICIEQSSSL